MALSTREIAALNSLTDTVPGLGISNTRSRTKLKLGTLISTLQSTDSTNFAAMKAATAVTAVANASDLATAVALVNDIKAKYNALATAILALNVGG